VSEQEMPVVDDAEPVLDFFLQLPTEELTRVFLHMCEVGEDEQTKSIIRNELKRRPNGNGVRP
jgi:hypothetical protein